MNFIKNYSLKSKRFMFLNHNCMSSIASLENQPFKSDPQSNTVIELSLVNFLNNSRNLNLTETKITHAHLLKTWLLYSDIFTTNNLLDSYFKCCQVAYAFQLFEEIPHPNMVTWNLMISGCNKNSHPEDSWRVFRQMHFLGIDMNQFTYGSVLSACTLDGLMNGEQVYSFVVKNGFFSNGYIRSGMIDLFSKSCRFKDALRVFNDVSCDDNVVCWNSIMSAAVKNNENQVALDIFAKMCHLGFVLPNGFTFSSVLTACASLGELELGKGVQGWVIKCGIQDDVFVGTTILDLYAKCGAMDEAVKQFTQMPFRNVVSWTAIISGFVQQGDSFSAVWAFDEMKKTGEDINSFTITSVLTACANLSMLKEAFQIHCWILKTGLYSDPTVAASLINTYSKIRAVDLSEMVFAETQKSKQELGVWTNMISAYSQNLIPHKAINLVKIMLNEGMKPDRFSISSILSIVDCLTLGRQIHCYALKACLASDVSVGSSLFTMYSKCGNLEDSHKVFARLEGKDNVSWASMIAGLAEHGLASNAIMLFREMMLENFTGDKMSLAAGLTACSSLPSLKIGKEIHGFTIRYGFINKTIIDGALVNMYSKSGDLNSARAVFKLMPVKDQFSCSSLVSGYSQSGRIDEALQFFHEILLSDLDIDSFTISSILGGISAFNIQNTGTQLHARVIKTGMESLPSVGSSLITMYTKHGNLEDCSKVFDQMNGPDLVTYTTMITSYAQHGKGLEALSVYNLMRKSKVTPDEVTFVGVISACSHAGLVEEGYHHLTSMRRDYGIEPSNRHYACMVDVLGRAGRLDEAVRFIKEMVVKPDGLVWGTLLSACRVHGDVELGKVAAEKMVELGCDDAGVRVSLSNICADAGQWEDVLKIRAGIKETGLWKEPGWSSV